MRFLEEDKLVSCVHCGLCLQSCPTYVEVGNEADSPRGRILLLRALEEGRLEPTPETIAHLDGCLGCRACETACPSGVPYGSLIETARPFLERHRPLRVRLARRLLGAALTRPTPRRLLFAPLRAAGGSRPLRAAARALARTPLGPWLAYAAATPPARGAAPLPAVVEAEGAARGTAVYLPGCVAATAFPDTARATVRLLARAGVRVVVAGGSGCCGALSLHLGDVEGARRHARTLLAALPRERVDWIVPSAAGCGAFLCELAHVVGEARAAEVGARVRDPLALLAELGLPAAERPIEATIAVHDPCHLAHGQGVRDQPRALLRAIPGVHLVELADADTCCGSAGTYNLTEPAMAARLRERKLDRVAESGAEVIAAANPGCLLQIRAGAIARGLDVAIEHPIDLLAAAHGVGEPRAARPRWGRAAAANAAVACAVAAALACAAAACSSGDDRGAPAAPTPTSAVAAHDGGAPISTADAKAIERTIRAQLAAIAVGDAATAFSFAAPAIQEMFGTPESFLRMVRTAYAPLVAPRDVRFAPPMLVAGEVTQKVFLVDAQGRPGAALFLMDRTSGGRWHILGCVLAKDERTAA